MSQVSSYAIKGEEEISIMFPILRGEFYKFGKTQYEEETSVNRKGFEIMIGFSCPPT